MKKKTSISTYNINNGKMNITGLSGCINKTKTGWESVQSVAIGHTNVAATITGFYEKMCGVHQDNKK